MPINPIHFAHSVCDEFLRYIFSAFPLADPDLAAQARSKLTGKSSLDIPLVHGPFVSLSEAFAKGEPVQALADRGLLHAVMPGLIGYPSMWQASAAGLRGGPRQGSTYWWRPARGRARPSRSSTRSWTTCSASGTRHHIGHDGDPHLPDERPGQRPA